MGQRHVWKSVCFVKCVNDKYVLAAEVEISRRNSTGPRQTADGWLYKVVLYAAVPKHITTQYFIANY